MSALFWLLDIAFFLLLILAPAAWLMTPLELDLWGLDLTVPWSPKLLVLPLAALVPRGLLALRAKRDPARPSRGLWERALFKKLSLAVATTFFFFLVVEQVLELVGFEAHLPPMVIKGEDDGQQLPEHALVRDLALRWKFTPGTEFRGRVVNSLGFLDREVDPHKKPGTIRVICMGDSITAQAVPPYSGRLHALLTNAPPTDREWEAFNMGVHGYSVVQGYRLFQLQTRDLQPDVVTLYFGWNDHWLGGRVPDRTRMAIQMGSLRGRVMRVLRNKRFGQLLICGLAPERNRAVHRTGGCFRVPPEEYRETLARFIRDVRAIGAVPLVITAPRTDSLPQALVQNGQAESIEAALEAHDRYLALTRSAAEDADAEVLDFAAIMEGRDKSALMSRDGIHLSKEGLTFLAQCLYDKLHAMSNEPGWRSP